MRFATLSDIVTLHALIERAYRGDSARAGWTHEADVLDGQRIDAAMLADSLADPAQTLLMTDAGDGCVCASNRGDHGYIGLLTVDPARQGGGLGRELLTAAEAALRAQGLLRVEMTVIHTRHELIDWYLRCGYRHTGRTAPFPAHDPRFGIPKADFHFVVMERPLI